METKFFKGWWTYTIKGVFAIAYGLVALLVNNASTDWLVQLFGGFLILGGIFLLGGAIFHLVRRKKWGWWFFEGLTDLVIGVLVLAYHNIYADLGIFMLLVAIWAIAVGFNHLFSAMMAGKEVKTRWMLLVNAVIAIAAAFMFFFNPFEAIEDSLHVIGIFAIVYGTFILLFSFGLKEG